MQYDALYAYFIERLNDEYKFVHKSFYEYFVAQKIIALVKSKNFKNPLVYDKTWSAEVQNFFYESFSKQEIEESESEKIPYKLSAKIFSLYPKYLVASKAIRV